MLALSTSWLGADHPTVESTIRAAHEVGFNAFEIGVAGEMLSADEFKALADELGLTYVSVHNIANRRGVPPDEVRGDGLSSTDAAVRERAIAKTIETIELARAVGARCVVIHAGEVETPDGDERQRHAVGLINAGRIDEARAFMKESLAARNALAPKYVEIAGNSLAEVFRRTGNFPIGLECRVHYYSIPLPGEFDFLYHALLPHPVSYWHDTGHARVGEMLGLWPALAWLERFGRMLAGFHFHDVRVMSDHEVPGTGDLDFTTFKPYVKEDTIRVIELHYGTSAAQLVAARRVVEGAGIE